MKLHVALSIFSIGFSGCALANSLPEYDATENTASLSKKITNQNTNPASILSMFLYLPLVDDAAWSSTMAQSQMTVTPTSSYVVNNILTTQYISQNGSCAGGALGAVIIGGTGDVTVTLLSGHAYTTSDASNRAWWGLSTWGPTFDATMQLRNGTTNVGASACIAGNGTCTDVTNCGWSAPRTWTP